MAKLTRPEKKKTLLSTVHTDIQTTVSAENLFQKETKFE